MAKLLHIFYHKEGTFSLLCQQVQLFTHSILSFLFSVTKYICVPQIDCLIGSLKNYLFYIRLYIFI